MNIILRATLNCERDLLWGGIGGGVSIFVTCQRPQARQEASRSQAHQSLAQPTRSLRNEGAVFLNSR